MTVYQDLKRLLTRVLLLSNSLESVATAEDPALERAVELLINGQYMKLVIMEVMSQNVFQHIEMENLVIKFINTYGTDVVGFANGAAERIVANFSSVSESIDVQRSYALVVAILFLQLFVEANFTGPKLSFKSSTEELGFIRVLSAKAVQDEGFASSLQQSLLKVLSIGGQQPYSLTESPLFLVLSLRILEILQGTHISLFDEEVQTMESEIFVEQSGFLPGGSINTDNEVVMASVCWWRARALQILQSLYPDYSGTLTVLCMKLLSPEVVSSFIDESSLNSSVNQSILLCFHLESAKCALLGNSESRNVDFLAKAAKVSGLEFILTGCKAKRTKYQENSVATLTVLAKSQDSLLKVSPKELGELNPLDIKLNDDTFLERPLYDDLGNVVAFQSATEGDAKRIKFDYSLSASSSPTVDVPELELSKRLIPTAIHKEDIPQSLCSLDPNNQPALSNLDSIQLLLRVEAVKQNSPQGSTLLNEELIALVQRVLFSPEGTVNWLVFSRALWYRSLLETERSRTVERGVLQLSSLVEELGVTSDKTARLFPKTDDEIQFPGEFTDMKILDSKQLTNSVRLRYIYLLPPMPKWAMDLQLAEKLIHLGLHKSALEIYDRLQKWTDAAVCCASTGDSREAEKFIEKTLERNSRDARAWYVLGNIRSDPELWEKSWQYGRYANAKRSLARYYYNPPKASGIKRDLQKAIDHMYDCLTADPISFANWYFYGCLGLEVSNYVLASEAFRRCLSIDTDSPYAWSNLASALIKLHQLPEAFHALGKAVNVGDVSKGSWKVWENYLIVAVKLGKWNEVLNASIILLDAKKDSQGNGSLDLPITEKLIGILVNQPYSSEKLSFFQRTCIDFVCNKIPSVVDDNPRCWRDIAKVDMWRKKPWLALGDFEKAYRATLNSPQLTLDEGAWNEAIETCSDLVSAYDNLGGLPGRLGAGDVVCKDRKFKARSAIRSLISKGKKSWEFTAGYEKLREMKGELISS
ncbi:hypothetical protein FOA43_001191 [Brettanomyces nanus]|uniref:Tetratricopeptide repeat protein n=1 Tax=Eeniella nana TaxID=13502 RepID=A0A875RXR6_EENNA|nr:uncharacterized protein FOA43_001191 [Brettanomyces nanus]QPG73876.1 hypothetical protein FOA43_001191 [Brettanomyces nanus]